jgi:hypothetical protein
VPSDGVSSDDELEVNIDGSMVFSGHEKSSVVVDDAQGLLCEGMLPSLKPPAKLLKSIGAMITSCYSCIANLRPNFDMYILQEACLITQQKRYKVVSARSCSKSPYTPTSVESGHFLLLVAKGPNPVTCCKGIGEAPLEPQVICHNV